jgi:5'(3')-deoxyribonucleotidase
MSSLAMVGNNVMMNMSATKSANRNTSQLNKGQWLNPNFQTLSSKAAVTVRPQSITKVDKLRNINMSNIHKLGSVNSRFNPNFY